MIKSMTGYGRAAKTVRKKTVTVEIRSLNSKGLDLNIRMPLIYKEKEISLRNSLAETLERGKIDVFIGIDMQEEMKSHYLNKSLIKSYYSDLKNLAKEMKWSGQDLFALTMRMPNVVYPDKESLDEQEWKQILTLIDRSVRTLDQFRQREGKVLGDDLLKRIKKIQALLSQIGSKEKGRITKIRKRLHKELQASLGKKKIDQDRFEQELMYYLDKIDISEEQLRLKTHSDYFISELKSGKTSKGKKLGFIGQEIGREINTIGSKANDAAIQKTVIQMKDELEKIKEQVNNIL